MLPEGFVRIRHSFFFRPPVGATLRQPQDRPTADARLIRKKKVAPGCTRPKQSSLCKTHNGIYIYALCLTAPFGLRDATTNLFQFGQELAPADLVDRDEEIATCVRTIQQRERLFMIGPRRYTEKLAGGYEKASEKIKRFFASLRPEVTFNVSERSWSAILLVELDQRGVVAL